MAKKKKEEAPVGANFDFSDVFDEVETSSKIQAIEVRDRLDANIAISSGSLAMDLVILHGGYYPGRAYDLVGSESSGKCLLGSSLIPTPKGIFKIKDLVGEDVDGLVEKQVEIYTRHGLRKTSHVFAKESATKKVTFANGNVLQGTPEHPALIYKDGIFNDEAHYNWRRLDELQEGDIVAAVFDRQDYFASSNVEYDYNSKFLFSNTVSNGLSEFLGFLSTSEGIEVITKAETVAQVYNYFKYRHFTAFQNELKIEIRKGTDAEILQDLRNFVKYLGLELDKETVEIPWAILRSSISVINHYINGFMRYSCDPSVYGCGFKCPNKQFAQQMQTILYMRGTVSVISYNEKKDADYINIPFIRDACSSSDNFTLNYGKVASVEDGETQKVYDLTVPIDHEFIANNLVVHNTTSGNTVLGEALTFVPKYSVGHYYDYEGSLDTTWFMNIAGMSDEAPETVFGKRDKKGNWVVKPRIRLYKPTFGEQGLILMTKHLNSLPDKGMFRDEWWYTWAPVEAKVKKQTGGMTAKDIEEMLKQRGIQWDKEFLKKNKLYGVRIPDNFGGCEGIIFVDSWATMTPRQTAEDNSAAMAQQGRMFAKYISQIKTLISNKGWICIGVNQVRQNPNVKFGCFHYRTLVLLEDGSYCQIGKIVNNQLFDKRVICYDFKKGSFEKKRIVRGWKYPTTVDDRVLKVSYKAYNRGHSGNASFIATDNHIVYTSEGEKPVKDLHVGDYLLRRDTTKQLSQDQKQILYGVMLGDGELEFSREFFTIKMNHVDYQKNYLIWKSQFLGKKSDMSSFSYKTKKGDKHELYSIISDKISIRRVPECFRMKKRSQKEIDQSFIDKLDIRAVAVWFMDDGTTFATPKLGWRINIACNRFSDISREKLRVKLEEILNVDVKIIHKEIRITKKEDVISAIEQLAPYVHPCMKYKLLGLVSNKKIGSYVWKKSENNERLIKVEITSIEDAKMSPSKYDLEIEDNHNYLIGGNNGVVVHNSPEYQPGGEALKHFCDCRNRYGAVSNPNGGGQIEVENNGLDEYRHFNIRNRKNKISTPYGKIEGRFWTKRDGRTGCGIDPVLDTLKYLEYTGQIERTRKGFRIALQDNSKASGKLNDLVFSYKDFKNLILNNEVDTGKSTAKFNLRNHCKKQIKSGIAFDLYYKAVGNDNNDKDTENEGEEDE